MKTLLTYAIISLWTVSMLALGYAARDYATRDVAKFEQVPMIGINND